MKRAVVAASAAVVGVLLSGCSSAAPHAVTVQQQKRALAKALTVGRGPATAAVVPQVRLGLMADSLDATGLAAVRLGYFAVQLGGTALDAVPYESAAAEERALVSGRLDAAYVDPVAAVQAWQATGGQFRIMSGAASGGTELVAHRTVTSVRQLAGKLVAAPAGSEAAAALAAWLHGAGVSATSADAWEAGPALLAAFRAGTIAAAWEPAPLDSQLVRAGGHVLAGRVDARGGEPTTAVLVVSERFLVAHSAEVDDLLKGQMEANELLSTDPAAGLAAAGTELASILRNGIPRRLVTDSLAQVHVTNAPGEASILAEARTASAAGLLRPFGSLGSIFDLGPLNLLLRAAGQPAVSG
jgi:NitT/TauT family transport system substrate-binding protein